MHIWKQSSTCSIMNGWWWTSHAASTSLPTSRRDDVANNRCVMTISPFQMYRLAPIQQRIRTVDGDESPNMHITKLSANLGGQCTTWGGKEWVYMVFGMGDLDGVGGRLLGVLCVGMRLEGAETCARPHTYAHSQYICVWIGKRTWTRRRNVPSLKPHRQWAGELGVALNYNGHVCVRSLEQIKRFKLCEIVLSMKSIDSVWVMCACWSSGVAIVVVAPYHGRIKPHVKCVVKKAL